MAFLNILGGPITFYQKGRHVLQKEAYGHPSFYIKVNILFNKNLQILNKTSYISTSYISSQLCNHHV